MREDCEHTDYSEWLNKDSEVRLCKDCERIEIGGEVFELIPIKLKSDKVRQAFVIPVFWTETDEGEILIDGDEMRQVFETKLLSVELEVEKVGK